MLVGVGGEDGGLPGTHVGQEVVVRGGGGWLDSQLVTLGVVGRGGAEVLVVTDIVHTLRPLLLVAGAGVGRELLRLLDCQSHRGRTLLLLFVHFGLH